jgi:hypothetical protein
VGKALLNWLGGATKHSRKGISWRESGTSPLTAAERAQ